MKIKFYTNKIAILYNFYGNQKRKARNLKSRKKNKNKLIKL